MNPGDSLEPDLETMMDQLVGPSSTHPRDGGSTLAGPDLMILCVPPGLLDIEW